MKSGREIFVGLIFIALFSLISFWGGYNTAKDDMFHKIKWYPRLPWQDYLKEQGHYGEKITKIYIEKGNLYVGTESGFLVPNVIER